MLQCEDPKTTRRSALRTLCSAGTLASLGTFSRRAVAAERKSSAYALIGDRYHPADYIMTALTKTLVTDLGLSIDFEVDVRDLSAERLDGYRMLIIFRDGMSNPNGYGVGRGSKIISEPPVPALEEKAVGWITPSQGKAIKDFVQRGGAAFFYHNTNYISTYNADFRDVEGGVTEGHPPLRPFRVNITNRDHPITRGVKDFLVNDEQHFMKYEKDPKFVFMRSANEDGLTYQTLGSSAESGWAYDYGKGRVCFLAPGHTLAALWNPEYVKLQQNAANWLLRKA